MLSFLLLVGLVLAIVNFIRHLHFAGFASSALLVLVFVCLFFIFWFMRTFALKAQDRAIRAEESLRYFILSGKAIDKRITMGQIIAQRFAADEEFLALVDKAASEGMAPKDIKAAIVAWRADHHRA